MSGSAEGQVAQKCGSGTSDLHRPSRAELRNRNFRPSQARSSGSAEVELQIFTCLVERNWHSIWYGLADMIWRARNGVWCGLMGTTCYMVWPCGNGMVYAMAWRASHGIWYGLANMAWYMVWPGEVCHGTCIWKGIVLHA